MTSRAKAIDRSGPNPIPVSASSAAHRCLHDIDHPLLTCDISALDETVSGGRRSWPAIAASTPKRMVAMSPHG
jgi:hypothetical protein